MIADSVLAVLLQIEGSPASVRSIYIYILILFIYNNYNIFH